MYNVELFDMFNNTFVDHFLLNDDIEIGHDYISPRTIDVKAPADINIALKNTVRVRDIDRGKTIFVGFVQGFRKDINATEVTLAPIVMLLNEMSMQNVFDDINNQNWAYQIHNQIYNDFSRSTPTIYKIPWVYASSYPISNWSNEKKVGYGAELKNDMDCVISRAKAKGLYMRFGLYTSGANLGRPSYGFYKFTSSFTVEADLDNVIDRKITETIKEGYDTALLWTPRDNLGNYNSWSACIINGRVEYGYNERMTIENPRLIQKVLDAEVTAAEREKHFLSMLQVGSDNVEIELTFKQDDKLIAPYWSEGKPATIITKHKTYNTYCTGYSRKGDLLTLKFGTVRQGLTDILNREGV